jgi:hypothetical protein
MESIGQLKGQMNKIIEDGPLSPAEILHEMLDELVDAASDYGHDQSLENERALDELYHRFTSVLYQAKISIPA